MARQMKDSGIEWIDSIPSHWQTIKLCYVTEAIFLGKTPVYFEGENENYTLGQRNNQQYGLDFTGIKYSTNEHFASCNEQEFLQYGDVLLNSLGTGSVGRIGYFDITDKRVLTDGHIIVIRANEQMNARFLFFYLRTLRKKFEDDAVGSTNQAFLTVPKIYKTPLPFPPLPEQQRIAAFLDRKCAEIDSVIELTKATIEEYKKLKQAVITEAVTKGVRGPRPMKDSGIEWIGEIPEGWEVVKATRLIISTQNGLTRRDLDKSDGYIVLKLKNITASGQLDYSEINRIQLTDKELEAYQLSDGDFLFVRVNGSKNLVGKCAIYHDISEPVAYNDHIIRVRLNDWCDRRYFQWFLLSDCGKVEIDLHTSTAAGQFTISGDGLRDLHVVLPSLSEQIEIVEHLHARSAAFDTLIAKKTALLTELETYKKSLIYEYVTGKTEVVDVQAQEQAPIVYPSFPAVTNTDKPRFAQAILMSKILDSNVKQMGRVKLEKMLYTIETSIGFDFDTEYAREAAGPLHSSIYECEGIIGQRNKWFTLKQSQHGVSYTPTSSKDKYKKYYDKYFGDYAAEIDRIISVFRDYTMDQAEIIATLFAAWNDAIIDQKQFTDEDIVDDVLNNWHESKKRFPRDVWLRAMEQMRKNGLVPKGYGKRTVIKKMEI